eukprot:TRINITY_DN126710_c0_g1_i1.p2 TRINITY_DN126710_c0_g1~~TRINITY_DN126710_c0_g1_i1.p2  ORF type:complete len:104 (-),score=2.33 TRINITY_DN126710_c0_g1_i1:276-587(-)
MSMCFHSSAVPSLSREPLCVYPALFFLLFWVWQHHDINRDVVNKYEQSAGAPCLDSLVAARRLVEMYDVGVRHCTLDIQVTKADAFAELNISPVRREHALHIK